MASAKGHSVAKGHSKVNTDKVIAYLFHWVALYALYAKNLSSTLPGEYNGGLKGINQFELLFRLVRLQRQLTKSRFTLLKPGQVGQQIGFGMEKGGFKGQYGQQGDFKGVGGGFKDGYGY